MKQQKKRKLRISQCMIVKNEEKNIEQALSWGKNVMWEQIVVDTGSTDRTVELAEELGAKVYHFSWDDDFAAAKNFAIDQAKGDWIVFLDADEYMEAKDGKELYELLSDIESARAPYLAVYSAILNVGEDGSVIRMGSHMRFFKNRSEIRYVGRIHEHLKWGEREFRASELLDASKELSIYHTGYTRKVFRETGKLERNERLLQREVEEHPDDVSMMGYLAHNYVTMEKYDLAVEWYEKAVRAYVAEGHEPIKQDENISRIFSNLLYYLSLQEGKLEQIVDIYGQAVQAITGECDFDYIMGMLFVGRENWENAFWHLERALELYKENGNLFWGEMLSRDLPRAKEYLVISCFNAGERERCEQLCTEFLKEDRFTMGILKVFLTVLQTGGMEGEQALGVNGTLYDLTQVKDRIFLLKAAKETGYGTLEHHLWNLFSPQEQALLHGKF